MGFRLRKKIKILPGVSLNLSKSGITASLKAGPVSWNSKAGKVSVNLPGPLSYQTKLGNLTKADLIGIAKRAGVKGYSKLKKQELIEFLRSQGVL